MITELGSWKLLEKYADRDREKNLNQLFSLDIQRFNKYSLHVGSILLDYSKNLVADDTMEALFKLARDVDVEDQREKMFAGSRINMTEERPVLHTALRNRSSSAINIDDINVMTLIDLELQKMRSFVDSVRSGEWVGYSGKRITDVVNIGIGGSDLGPQMVTEALSKYSDGGINVHYVSNVDSFQIAQVLRPLKPEQVLFIVSSKTFTTRETLTNANTAKNWLMASSFDEEAVEKHFVAVTSNQENALKFGLPEENVYSMWDWVGGRFSLWSAIGLPVALNLGFDKFEELLEGAFSMDQHFRTAPLEQNAPVILALIGIWNNNFMGFQTHAILPYSQPLHMFPAYLQQAEMESNGKSVDWEGNETSYSTGPVLWGQLGINGQHAFYQYLHQGKNIVPSDFIGAVESTMTAEGHQEYLMANLFAQTQALMTGIDECQVREDLKAKGKCDRYINKLVSHKVHKGNRPTTTILLQRIDPYTLGALIALYEHKIFVQGVIWQICSFDQWGVELGKELANNILPQLEESRDIEQQDSSTMGLIRFYKEARCKSTK